MGSSEAGRQDTSIPVTFRSGSEVVEFERDHCKHQKCGRGRSRHPAAIAGGQGREDVGWGQEMEGLTGTGG